MTIAWYDPTNHHVSTDKNDPLFTPLGQVWPLYPKREFVGLTDEEIITAYETSGHKQSIRPQDVFAVASLARAIEAKLKEKNT
jgi:hypothetical protein